MGSALPDTIALFGATGSTGRRVLTAALLRGMRIRALVRRPMLRRHILVFELPGSLTDPSTLDAVLTGTRAVVIAFGQRPRDNEAFCAEATRCIIAAMRRCGITRLICQTGAMVGDYAANQSLPMRLLARFYRRSVPAVAADRVEQEQIVRESGLDWTLVKPPRLTSGRAKGRFRAGPDVRVGLLSSISRSDVAEFIVHEITSPRYLGHAVFLAD